MGYGDTAGYICSLYLECVRRIWILHAVMRGSITEEVLKFFLNECSMRNEICPEPCWSNYSIGPMPPSDEDLYLTGVWMLLMRTAWGRPYFTMGVLIT